MWEIGRTVKLAALLNKIYYSRNFTTNLHAKKSIIGQVLFPSLEAKLYDTLFC